MPWRGRLQAPVSPELGAGLRLHRRLGLQGLGSSQCPLWAVARASAWGMGQGAPKFS